MPAFLAFLASPLQYQLLLKHTVECSLNECFFKYNIVKKNNNNESLSHLN
jgi:hypothetical protein